MELQNVLLPPDADPRLGPVLSGLKACLCAVLADGGRPVCSCCLVWGASSPAQDFCTCECNGGRGQAWVRIVRQVPYQDSRASGGKCLKFRKMTEIELGVARCVAVTAPDGKSPPTCEQREEDAWGMVLDQRLLLEAAACCDALSRIQMQLLSVEPFGPQGGCAGVKLQMSIEA